MVAVVHITSSFARAFHYNERKVRLGAADFIHAGNFLEETRDLKPAAIRARFTRLDELNKRSAKKTFHASLNFHPDERLSDMQLSFIADRYMEILGLGKQPFLVYKHMDAAHPHIHLLTTLIDSQGKKICTYSSGRELFLNATRQIEMQFGLVQAGMTKRAGAKGEMLSPQILHYGKSPEVFNRMENILEMAMRDYRFRSIQDFNALLAQYNLHADRGSENSLIYKKGGLVFHVLDINGNRTGIPLKASAFGSKPTLKNLLQKIESDGPLEETRLQSIRSRIDWTLIQADRGFEEFVQDLAAEDIRLVLQPVKSGEGNAIFVDFRTRTAVSSLDLGNNYSALGILNRLSMTHAQGLERCLSEKAGSLDLEDFTEPSELEAYKNTQKEKRGSWPVPGVTAHCPVRSRRYHR